MKAILVLALMMAAVTACWAAGRPAPSADGAFRQLRSLSGDWEGKDQGGTAVHTSFRVVADGTTVLETLKHGDMEEMLSLYGVDGDSIALQHYCPTNNQSADARDTGGRKGAAAGFRISRSRQFA
jgi:hypothetical protein